MVNTYKRWISSKKYKCQKIWHLEFFRVFVNLFWDDLVDGWKHGRMDGWMVPRWIMVFVFRLCLLRISMIGAVVCIRIIFHPLPFQQLPNNLFGCYPLDAPQGNFPRVWSLDSSPRAKARPNFRGKLDLGITNWTGVVPCSEMPPFSLKIASKFCPN